MPYLYHETPCCPKCNSPITGYFVYGMIDNPMMVKRALKKGELIEFAPSENIQINNCLCFQCGFRWSGTIAIKLYSKKQIEQKKEEKGITKDTLEKTEQYYQNKKQKKKRKRYGLHR